MDKQEYVEGEHAKGVRRPRSDAARRPRPQSGFLSTHPGDGPSTSHPSYGSYRESRVEQPASAHDRSTEERLRDTYADVMGLGSGHREGTAERTEEDTEVKFYTRNGIKDHHYNDMDRVDAMVEKVESRVYRDETRRGRDDFRADRDVGRGVRDDLRAIGEEKGGSYAGKGARDYENRNRENGQGREEGRVGRDEGGRFASRKDEYRDNRFSAREETFSDRRFQRRDDRRDGDRGEWRDGNWRLKPEFERGKRLEKSMKEIVEKERHLKEGGDVYRGEQGYSVKDKVGRWRERDDRFKDSGRERGERDWNQTGKDPGIRDGRGYGETRTKTKLLENGLMDKKATGYTKLKLKVGGVTHTLVSDSGKKKRPITTAATAATPKTSLPPRATVPEEAGTKKRRRHRLILQEQSDDEEEIVGPQTDSPPLKAPRKESSNGYSPVFKGQVDLKTSPGARSGGHAKTNTSFVPASPVPAVRKSSRVPKRRVLDGDEEDAEEGSLLQRHLSQARGGGRVEEVDEQMGRKAGEEDWGEGEDASTKVAGISSDEEILEDPGDEEDDEDGTGRAKRGRVQQLHSGAEIEKIGTGVALTARQRSMQTSRDADGEAVPSLIEYPEGLTASLGRKGKGKLSEAERQVKRVEAARRRKQQVEKTARDIQATAIQKILGQDSTRKRREDRLQKQRQDIEEGRKAAELVPATNSIRWNLGPAGTVVSFAEDVGLPSFFNSSSCRHPPAREKCAAPECLNAFKYRDSKSKVPLCSLQCYRVIHHASTTASAY